MKANKNNKIDLLWQFTRSSFKMRYQNSLLGVLWVLIKPYAIFSVLYFVWSQREGDGVDNYGVYLLIGVVFYSYFQELLHYGNMSLIDKGHVILKANFARQIAIVSSLFVGLINLFINLGLLFIIMIVVGIPITILGFLNMLWITLIMFVFGAGVALFTSIINVRFRDLKNIFELGFFLLYWVSAVVFVPEKFDGIVGDVMRANPIAIMLNQVRAGYGVYSEVNVPLMIGYFGFALALFGLGWMFFSKNIRKIAEYF